ncbi:MAG: hypothetical protein N2446_02550 [Elusimicrobiales bacterium]|nr:hypothetical protein [Elusimicrobiales bacterium]
MEKIINFIASGFGISYLPIIIFKRKGKFKGCGLFGTSFAFSIYQYVIPENSVLKIILIILIISFSILISEKAFNQSKDNPLIVIDEIAGY